MSYPHALTAAELLRLNLSTKRTELVRGVLRVREPASYRHGELTVALTLAIGKHVEAHDLGRVLAAETGFKLTADPDTVRAPDLAFIRSDRLPDPAPQGYAELAPDLVVEVLSPADRPGEVLARVGDWLTAGTRLVWVVDPIREVVRVYRADGSDTVASKDANLAGEDVLPGFTCALALLFRSG
ncbi:MAG TPA: Uma2 family endonuclease [Gemmatimonadales bacterium]